MKIKNLFLLLLLLVGFASCSGNDEDDEILEPGMASLTLKLVPQGGYGTKAEDPAIKAWASESKVSSYVVLLFRNGGTPLVYPGKGTGDGSIETEAMPAGTVVSAYAFVNLSDKVIEDLGNVTDPTELAAFTESLDIQNTNNLTMASTTAATLTLAEGNNSLDVNITRLVSRIQVSSIQTSFKISNNYTVLINKLELANAKNTSLLYAAGAAEGEDEFEPDFIMVNQVKDGNIVSNASPLKLTKQSEEAEGEGIPIPYGYVFENTNKDNPTQLLLTATLLDENSKEVSTKKFMVTINATGANPQYVRRNYIYDLGLTFNDESFDMAALVVKVTVVPWGKVHQSSEVD